jgi:hypothetical protein
MSLGSAVLKLMLVIVVLKYIYIYIYIYVCVCVCVVGNMDFALIKKFKCLAFCIVLTNSCTPQQFLPRKCNTVIISCVPHWLNT